MTVVFIGDPHGVVEWERRGCPVVQYGSRSREALFETTDVLAWRLRYMAETRVHYWQDDEWLAMQMDAITKLVRAGEKELRRKRRQRR